MRVLLVGDIHLSDKPPSSCTDTYCDDLLDLLEQTVELAQTERVDGVVWAGDVFHHKQPSRTSHRLVQRALEVVQAYSVPILVVPGNHDMQNDRFDSLYETQPLGVLLSAGAELLRGWHAPTPFGGGLPIYGCPWLQRFDKETVSAALKEWRDDEGPKTHALVIAHAPLYPPGLELPYEFTPATEWADAMANLGYCYYGHVHERHGVYAVSGVTFCNAGAITRGSLHESELTRMPAVTVWSPETGFHEIPLDAKPPEQVFRLTEKLEQKNTAARLDEFLESLGQTQLDVTSIEAVLEHVRSMGLDADVTGLIEELLALAG